MQSEAARQKAEFSPVLPPSSIRAMPDVLSWTSDGRQLAQVHDSWVALAADALGAALRRVSARDGALGQELVRRIRALSDTSFERLLLAPETTFHLLPGRPVALDETARFLRRALRAEAALLGPGEADDEEAWTALGDAHVTIDGVLLRGPQLDAMMPIDVGSPFSSSLDLTGVEYRLPHSRPPLAGDELASTLERIRRVGDALAIASPHIHHTTVRFTKVLILQKDEQLAFSSGSNGEYVGRSFLANPHHASECDLADAIVHEAIHSVLYMQEEQQRWVLDTSLYAPVAQILSPWSGIALPLRPFIQACFVWYGLLHFWAAALAHDAFPAARSRYLFTRAASGFMRGPLLARIEPYLTAVTDDISDTVAEMQARVVTLIEEFR